ncbi:VOC family protein [Actinomadura rayongensis]|uniref:Glyoxalase/bleomycin resistance/extradiol dioxygenase family protein n=1 Tax=Actinomadura rayongensis TaxID=1429076 RepID=A0A6I4WK69_9ACTN|nr:VOC family protein [Actinomadura rayongensis]MXQ67012.1 glyoxalase/bleomycin resistance/extradiol dioxygenase family protein [Actinomadura rayongensis]
MDALYPRLLVDDFAASARFYEEALRELLGIEPVKVVPEARYANWDLDGQAVLSLFGRAALAEITGEAGPSAGEDRAMLVFRVDDVDAAAGRLSALGAQVVAAAQDRPAWGATLRTAHLRDPEGNLIELQSY